MQKAIADHDLNAFRAAKKDAKSADDAPPEPPPALVPTTEDDEEPPGPAAVAGAPAPPRQISKRQQEKNDLIRARVEAERRADTLAAELAALRRPAAPVTTPIPAVDAEPDPNDPTKYPDGQYDRKFLKDQARFEARQEIKAAGEASANAQRLTQQQTAQVARETTYSDRMNAVLATEPAFFDTISEDVKSLKLFSQMAEGEIGSARNAIAEELVDSAIPHTLMRHFTDHPEDLTRLAALPPRALAREFGKLEAKLESPATPAPPPLKTITSMPAPPPVVGSKTVDPDDPEAKALRDRDFPAYQRALRAREKADAAARV